MDRFRHSENASVHMSETFRAIIVHKYHQVCNDVVAVLYGSEVSIVTRHDLNRFVQQLVVGIFQERRLFINEIARDSDFAGQIRNRFYDAFARDVNIHYVGDAVVFRLQRAQTIRQDGWEHRSFLIREVYRGNTLRKRGPQIQRVYQNGHIGNIYAYGTSATVYSCDGKSVVVIGAPLWVNGEHVMGRGPVFNPSFYVVERVSNERIRVGRLEFLFDGLVEFLNRMI